MSVVLDASAVLAWLLDEPGAEVVDPLLDGAQLSAVNLTEVLTKLLDRGQEVSSLPSELAALGVRIVPFDASTAMGAARLRPLTRTAGLSLGDRSCLALAVVRSAVALTADVSWGAVEHGVEVQFLR